MNEPNGLYKCFTCRKCSESKLMFFIWFYYLHDLCFCITGNILLFLGQGLYIQSKCTTIEDTTCDVLDGYYCREYSASRQCRLAQKHSVCKPGQGIKTQGNALNFILLSP